MPLKTKVERNRRRQVLVWSLLLFMVVICIGIVGYRLFFDMDWIDATYSAVVVLSTLSLEGRIGNPAQKIFIMFYALIALLRMRLKSSLIFMRIPINKFKCALLHLNYKQHISYI